MAFRLLVAMFEITDDGPSGTLATKNALISGLSTLMLSSPIAADQTGRGQAPLRANGPQSGKAFQIMAARPLGNSTPGIGSSRLDLDSLSVLNAEEVTVYARRHAVPPAGEDQKGVALGTIDISGSTRINEIGFSGMTVTASLPVPGIRGLEAVANLSGGHDAVNSSTTRESASLTAGFRLKF